MKFHARVELEDSARREEINEIRRYVQTSNKSCPDFYILCGTRVSREMTVLGRVAFNDAT